MEGKGKRYTLTIPSELKINSWGHGSIDFAFCSPPKNGDITMLSYPQLCRESTACELWTRFSESWDYNGRLHYKDLLQTIRTNKVHLLVRHLLTGYKIESASKAKVSFEKWVNRSLKILNLLEDKYGWIRSRMAYVDIPTIGAVSGYGAYFASDSKWMRSPYMLSLYLLLIRIARESWTTEDGVLDNYESFMSVISELKARGTSDTGHLKKCAGYFSVLFGRYKDLFGTSIQINYDFRKVHEKNFPHNREGITALCLCATRDTAMFEKFAKVVSEEFPRRNPLKRSNRYV